MVHQIRRVVTGHDKEGKSIFVSDGFAPNILEMESMPGVALTDLWRTKTTPASNSGNADAATGKIKLEPPESGTILRIVEFPPDTQWRHSANAQTAFKSIGAGHAPDHGSGDPMTHATATVDYIIVLKGEIYAIVDRQETLLKQGDVLVQRGTNHSWSVRANKPCIVAAVLISAKPTGRLAKRGPSAVKSKSVSKVRSKKKRAK